MELRVPSVVEERWWPPDAETGVVFEDTPKFKADVRLVEATSFADNVSSAHMCPLYDR
jgi:hypothetical protein